MAALQLGALEAASKRRRGEDILSASPMVLADLLAGLLNPSGQGGKS